MNSAGFQRKIGYNFNDKTLLLKALTHSSYINEKGEGCDKNNERLEFLGDAFLDAIISEELYKRLDRIEEGRLTKLRALIVCEKALARHGRLAGIGECLLLGKGEEYAGGREKDSILADALEAVIGAIVLDGGYNAARGVAAKLFESWIDDAVSGKLEKDYKTALQEALHSRGESTISYMIEKEEGPDHDKTFYIDLFCRDRLLGKGRGKSKKEAEQDAAKKALERGVDFVL